ncbi:hypothetical protein [Hyunsoonleella rubra]|uniref:T9SS C-terminal target domain-containing protein n=1 Tax=Hyunsoonleella rubra TaxID=1737062 RepID=A0ABW5T9Z3_9FLAO
MKNFTQIVFFFLLVTPIVFAQQEKGIIGVNNWLSNWTEFKPHQEDYGEPTQILAGNISESTILRKGEVYLLLGSVFVTNNATLTIEPGTVILGDFKTNGSLTISKGSTIIAKGASTDPIIFSSSRSVKRPGDWGGLTVLGEAPINRYSSGSVTAYHPKLKPADYAHTNFGGDSLDCSSGIIKYVRIEFAGRRLSEEDYFSGLLLAGVGNYTKLDHIMVSHSEGNAFEVWGGKVDMHNFVSFKSHGTDFRFNHGARVILNNSLAVRSPYASNGMGANCLEVLAYDQKEEFDFSKPTTFVKAKNLTFVNESKTLEADIKMNLIKEAVYVGDNAELDIFKSVVSGFNPAVILDEDIYINQESLDKIKLSEMYFNNCNGNIFVENNSNNDDLENWYGNSTFFNVYSKGDHAETFIDINNYNRPDFRLRINKIIASNADPDLRDD